ncbi:MAG: hypothetical protein DRN49_01640 [Thaumarchaeota archaeon]|nr:MAG: hypothetical protein DRN49_01640 [Nitrososphaerota archaeon]
MIKMENRPKKPEFEAFISPDYAVAKAVQKLTEDEAIEMLSHIKERDIPRLALLLSIAEDFKLDWLKCYVYHELKLSCSIKGRRAEQIVKVAKAPEFVERESLTHRIREKLGL